MSSVSLLHPELRGVLVVNIAKCIFVKHALSRTCRAFRKLFTNELFLHTMQVLHPGRIDHFNGANRASLYAIYALFPFQELLPSLEVFIADRDPNPFMLDFDFQLGVPVRIVSVAPRQSITRFEFRISSCHERYGELQGSNGAKIGPRLCHLFGCNCNEPNAYFEGQVRIVWKHNAANQCLLLDLIR